MRWAIFLVILFLPLVTMGEGGQGIRSAPLNVMTVDGTVSGWPYKLIFPNGSLTNNGDGTMTVDFGTVATAFILLEDGTFALLEDGGKIIKE